MKKNKRLPSQPTVSPQPAKPHFIFAAPSRHRNHLPESSASRVPGARAPEVSGVPVGKKKRSNAKDPTPEEEEEEAKGGLSVWSSNEGASQVLCMTVL